MYIKLWKRAFEISHNAPRAMRRFHFIKSKAFGKMKM